MSKPMSPPSPRPRNDYVACSGCLSVWVNTRSGLCKPCRGTQRVGATSHLVSKHAKRVVELTGG
jgi:hypothetical protein